MPLKDGTGRLRLIAHAGIGDSFPIKEETGRCLFEILVRDGDDDHLLLQVNSVEGSQKIDLFRDKPVSVRIGNWNYDLAYPSVTVAAAPGETPTTSQAMLLVHRFP